MSEKPTYEKLEQRIQELEQSVSKRKQAEEGLQKSEQRYRLTMEASLQGTYQVDTKGRITFANPLTAELTGYSLAELDGLSLDTLFPPGGAKMISDANVALLYSGKPIVGENTLTRGDGSRIETYFSYVPVLDESGEYMGFVGSILDITERKKAEEELRKEINFTKSSLDTLTDGFIVFDLEGKFLRWNKAMSQVTGYSDEEISSLHPTDFFLGEDVPSVMENIGRVLKEGHASMEASIVTNEGKSIPYEFTGDLFRDHEGNPLSICVVGRDITERLRADKALRESEEKYRIVLETSTDPIVGYDIEGKVTYFNPAFTRVFGWTLEERLGKKMDFFVPDEDWPETRTMIDKVMAGESFSGFETRRYTKEGKIIHVNVSASISKDQGGNPIGSVINLRDISEQKKLEAQLQRAQKMEAIGILAGGVAHDLNNVLSGIVSYPDLLLMQIPEDSPLIKPILTMQDSGKKAADIVQDLLTLARRGVVVEEVVNLNDVISEYLKSPEHEKLKSFHPEVEVESILESDLLNISGSPVHLSKAVMNLVSNAAEAMPDGGKIFISTENRYIDIPISGYDSIEEGDYITLTIADTGIGISSEDIIKIFEPFYTKKVMGKSGTGLGMAVVWSTVKDHKGYIDVHSTEGKGTTFTLYFPATRRARAKEKAILPIEKYMGRGESILVVDDVKEQREIVFNLLTILGYVVDTVLSGEEAVEYLKEHNVDLIVLDMIMDSGIDGLDTYKEILEVHPDQKAIIASGFSETDRVREAQRLGAGQYIKKPYTLEKIGIAVRAELDK